MNNFICSLSWARSKTASVMQPQNLLSWLGKYFRVEASTGREKNEQQGKHLSRL